MSLLPIIFYIPKFATVIAFHNSPTDPDSFFFPVCVELHLVTIKFLQ